MNNNKQRPMHWRSLDELEQTPAFKQAMEREFAEEVEAGALDGTTRRHFLGVMGASLAMTSLAGCVRRPEDMILPYSKAPEHLVPGIAQYYATAANIGGDVTGFVVESHEGRPTKIEGNPEHPGSLGGATAIHQALVLQLYDPNRLNAPRKGNAPVEWSALEQAITQHFEGVRNRSGEGLAVLTEAIPSPTFYAMRRRILATYGPGVRWFTYEPISDDNQRAGLSAAFGRPVRPVYRLNRAGVVVSLDSDFLATEGASVANGWQWARTRRIESPDQPIGRLYVVEGRYSVTGTNADHRLRLNSVDVETFAWALVAELQKTGRAFPNDIGSAAAERAAGLPEKAQKFAAAVAEDLLAARPNPLDGAVVIAGRRQSPIVHALAAAINESIGARGQTLFYYRDYRRTPEEAGDRESIAALTALLKEDKVDTLLVLGGNPVYTAPGDLGFAEAFKRAKTSIVLADYADETSKLATWAIPRAHFLETWGDLAFADGTVAIQQPLIAPLWGAWSEIELLARVLLDEATAGHQLVRNFWEKEERAFVSRHWGSLSFEKAWRRWLHDGRMSAAYFGTLGPADSRVQGLGQLQPAAQPKPSKDALELVFVESNKVHDGRYANNSWLQELPDPITKIVWDNAVLLSPATAKALGVEAGARVKLTFDGRNVDGVAWTVPGMADNTAALEVGYGRDFDAYLPYHDKGVVGFNVFPLRNSQQGDIVVGAKLAAAGGTYQIVTSQPYAYLEPGFDYPTRAIVRGTTVDGFKKNPGFAQPGIIKHGQPPPDAVVIHPPPKSIYGDWDYSKGYQWALVIDLNTCTGCSACVIACVAENNIPMVGKDQVSRGREMFWIRMDRYFTGDEGDAGIVHQPMTCLQCETAPCENVCPVAATSHSPEGLNDMTYNRCIGTRYCNNNCPVKVRRFNFYNFTKGQAETIHMQRNPDVTVRFRGVMEKCTYCVQRINLGKRHAKLAKSEEESRAAIDAIVPACAQTCPTDAIVFGDMNDENSAVHKLKRQPRNYGVLTELNLQPRTTYLAKVQNPNPKLAG